MATLFMRIDGLDSVDGAAMVEDIGGDKGWFAIGSINWSAARGVTMNIGAATNQDSGMAMLGEISVSKTYCGASPYLSTWLFYPGTEARDIYVVDTKPNREGTGLNINVKYSLTDCRISNYSLSGSDSSDPFESFSITYTAIEIEYGIEDIGGAMTVAGTVGFDIPTATLTSKADL